MSDRSSSRYAPVDQITAENVGQLEVAWRWTSPDEAVRAARLELWTHINQSTPLMVGGHPYTSTSMSQVAAIDAASGETRWVFDPESHEVDGVSSPTTICRDRVIVGSSITDYPRNKTMPPGDVRAFDVITGAQEWVFESIPRPGSFGVETWSAASWQHTGIRMCGR